MDRQLFASSSTLRPSRWFSGGMLRRKTQRVMKANITRLIGKLDVPS